MNNPFRYFKTSPEIIRLAVMMYIRFPLSLRQVEDLLNERGINICHETVRAWWNRFGGFVKLTDYGLFSAFLHEAKPLKLHIAAISDLPIFRSESG